MLIKYLHFVMVSVFIVLISRLIICVKRYGKGQRNLYAHFYERGHSGINDMEVINW